jgi:predicted site-specific integrase-resolvase
MVEDGPLLFTAELAKRLRVAAGTVQRWRREGLITPALVTPGGQARWVEADVREQLRRLEERRHDAVAEPDPGFRPGPGDPDDC